MAEKLLVSLHSVALSNIVIAMIGALFLIAFFSPASLIYISNLRVIASTKVYKSKFTCGREIKISSSIFKDWPKSKNERKSFRYIIIAILKEKIFKISGTHY